MQSLESLLATRFDMRALKKQINQHPEQFRLAVKLAASMKIPHGWHAAWLLGHACRKRDDRLLPYVDELIDAIPTKKDGHQRELIKLLTHVVLTEEQEGKLFDTCMTLWETPAKSPSVRYFSFRCICEVIEKYPELKNEMRFITQDHYLETLSPGIRNSVEKKLKELFG